jgi:hypothetical protein
MLNAAVAAAAAQILCCKMSATAVNESCSAHLLLIENDRAMAALSVHSFGYYVPYHHKRAHKKTTTTYIDETCKSICQ